MPFNVQLPNNSKPKKKENVKPVELNLGKKQETTIIATKPSLKTSEPLEPSSEDYEKLAKILQVLCFINIYYIITKI